MEALYVRYESMLIRTEAAKQQGLTANGPEFLLTAATMRHLLNAERNAMIISSPIDVSNLSVMAARAST